MRRGRRPALLELDGLGPELDGGPIVLAACCISGPQLTVTKVSKPNRRLVLTRAPATPRAVLWEIAAQVYTIERLGQLADKAAGDTGRPRLRQCSRPAWRRPPGGGWSTPPYDAIVVAAGGPQVPESLWRN